MDITPILRVWEQYKHLDILLFDEAWMVEDGHPMAPQRRCLYDCWKAIKKTVSTTALADKEAALLEQQEKWRDNKRYLENELALKMKEFAEKEATIRSLLSRTERFTVNYPNGARGCCCVFNNEDEIISSCKFHSDRLAEKDKEIAEYEEVIKVVKLASASIHERADRQAGEITRLIAKMERLKEALHRIADCEFEVSPALFKRVAGKALKEANHEYWRGT